MKNVVVLGGIRRSVDFPLREDRANPGFGFNRIAELIPP